MAACPSATWTYEEMLALEKVAALRERSGRLPAYLLGRGGVLPGRTEEEVEEAIRGEALGAFRRQRARERREVGVERALREQMRRAAKRKGGRAQEEKSKRRRRPRSRRKEEDSDDGEEEQGDEEDKEDAAATPASARAAALDAVLGLGARKARRADTRAASLDAILGLGAFARDRPEE